MKTFFSTLGKTALAAFFCAAALLAFFVVWEGGPALYRGPGDRLLPLSSGGAKFSPGENRGASRRPGDRFEQLLQPLSESDYQAAKEAVRAAAAEAAAGSPRATKPPSSKRRPAAAPPGVIYGVPPLSSVAPAAAGGEGELGRVQILRPQLVRGMVDLNTAPLEEIELLPAIGKGEARRILAYRARHAQGVRQLSTLSEAGISRERQEVIRPLTDADLFKPPPLGAEIKVVALEEAAAPPPQVREGSYRYQGGGQMTALLLKDFHSPLGQALRVFDGDGRCVASYAGDLGTFRTVFVSGGEIRLEFSPETTQFAVVAALHWRPARAERSLPPEVAPLP